MAKMPIGKFQFYDDHVQRFGGEPWEDCVCNADENKFGVCLLADAFYYGYDAGYEWSMIGSLISSARALIKRLETDKVELIPIEGWDLPRGYGDHPVLRGTSPQ